MIKKIILLCLLGAAVFLRLLAPGWMLIFGFWLIGAPYLLHLFAILAAFNKKTPSIAKVVLIIISTVILYIFTLLQYDCGDINCYYVYKQVLVYLGIDAQGIPEPCDDCFLLISVPLGLSVMILNIIILITNSTMKRKLKNQAQL